MTIVTPQPQRWQGYWLWLNRLYTTSEMCCMFDWQWNTGHRDGTWHWRIAATPKLVKRKRKE